MNLSRVKLIGEHPTHYEMHDGKGSFRVAKSGLSDELHRRIRSMGAPMADGGPVKHELTDVMHAKAPMETADERETRKRQEYADETGGQMSHEEYQAREQRRLAKSHPAEPQPEGVMARAGHAIADVFRKSTASAASMPATIPRYAEGGPVKPGSGAAYGLGLPPGVEFGPNAQYSLAPNPEANNMPPSNFQPPPQPQLTRTMVQTGTTPGGQPVVQPKDVELQNAIPGLSLKSEPAAAPAPTAAVPSGSGMNYGTGTMRRAIADERSALGAKGEAEAEQARQEAAIYAQQGKVLQASQIEEKQLQDRAASEANSIGNQQKQALEEMKNIDTTVDPGRYWASKTTGQKVLGIIGLALGAVGAGTDGVNKAAVMMSQAIDRDVEAQKAEVSARLAKGDKTLAGLQNMYAQAHQRYGDELAAFNASKATALGIVNNKVQQVAATAASPIAKANAQALSAQLTAAQAEFEQKAANAAAENKYKEAMAAAALGKSLNGKAPKNEELAKGAEEAVNDLERELKEHPTSPRIPQLRASVMLHMNKLQGGRFNEEINKMNQDLVPGNEGNSIGARLGEKIAPGLMSNNFNTLRKHIAATANTPPNPVYDRESQ